MKAVLVTFKALVWLGYALVYGLLFAPSYARIVFKPDTGDVETAHEHCAAVAACGPHHDALVADQIRYLSTVATFLRTSAWGLVGLDGVIVALAVVFAVGAWRVGVLRIVWRAQAAAVVAVALVYAVLMVVGSAKLSGIPMSAQLGAFKNAFDSPFTDFGTYYYLAGFVVSGVVTVGLTCALATLRSDDKSKANQITAVA
ncbi:hypothetical protein HC031_26385 [Planosporangium thailandense]|uniref:Integral membrane protein n=1 Tax=Planosporangium thailandense TaxID=765197 RepID=A0ABX0Y7G5_9ACTN|nr:hypothetical protein [Planosporangium thailandense]NJC73219.1 hypothetical protein [Planosporangium thailandense]